MSWIDSRTGYENIFGAHILADGSSAQGWPSNGLPICTTPGSRATQMVTDDAGGAFFLWTQSYPYDIYGIRIQGNGQVAPGWLANGSLIYGGPLFDVPEAMGPDGSGGVYIFWVEDPNDPRHLETDMYLIRVTAAGTVAPGWPSRGVPISTAPGDQYWGRIASDAHGAITVNRAGFFGGSIP